MNSRISIILACALAFVVAPGCADSNTDRAGINVATGGDAGDATDGGGDRGQDDGTDATDGADGTAIVDGGPGDDGVADGRDGDDAVKPPPPPESECGDGFCRQGEDAFNCPQDCEGPGPGQCLLEECTDIFIECQEDEGCLELLTCRKKCQGDGECNQECKKQELANTDAAELLQELMKCGHDNGCVGKGPPPDDCGNNKCEKGENPGNCPHDCEAEPPDVEECLKKNCPEQVSACYSHNGCKKLVECVKACESEKCEGNCMDSVGKQAKNLFNVTTLCGDNHGCFGDEPEEGSCEGKCGQFVENSPCQCNKQCVQFDGCCEDYFEMCTDQPPPKCGNGKCEPGENAKNCAKDCGDKPPPPSNSCEGKCGQFVENSPCQCDKQCVEFNDCCIDYQKLCTDEPPAKCGNGKCEPGESYENCPDDCKKPIAGSCKNMCGGYNKVSDCWCDDGCADDGDCCDDFAKICKDDPPPPDPTDTPMVCVNEKCKEQLGKCAQNFDCATALTCVNECGNNLKCATKCGDDLEDQAEKALKGVLGCAKQKQCFNTDNSGPGGGGSGGGGSGGGGGGGGN